MKSQCHVCNHPLRMNIDKDLVAGMSLRACGEKYGIGYVSVKRHKDHMAERLIQDPAIRREVQEMDTSGGSGVDLFAEVHYLMSRLKRIAEGDDDRISISAMKELRGNIELLAKLSIQLEKWKNSDVTNSLEWAGLRRTIFTALEPFPEARQAVIQALKGAGSDATKQ